MNENVAKLFEFLTKMNIAFQVEDYQYDFPYITIDFEDWSLGIQTRSDKVELCESYHGRVDSLKMEDTYEGFISTFKQFMSGYDMKSCYYSSYVREIITVRQLNAMICDILNQNMKAHLWFEGRLLRVEHNEETRDFRIV